MVIDFCVIVILRTLIKITNEHVIIAPRREHCQHFITPRLGGTLDAMRNDMFPIFNIYLFLPFIMEIFKHLQK